MEQGEVELDMEASSLENATAAEANSASSEASAATDRQSEQPNQTGITTTVDQQSVKIKYEEYRKIMNVLLHRLRKLEEEAEAAAAEKVGSNEGGEEQVTSCIHLLRALVSDWCSLVLQIYQMYDSSNVRFGI